MPRVSVIIPVFNQERYLAEAIESVLPQTYPDYELIVVDDGSTDGTPEVIRGYESRLRAFRKPNGGGASALNMGIREAQGEWIAWLSSDDLWEPTKLAHQMEAIEKSPDVGLVFTDDRIIDPAGRTLICRHFSLPPTRRKRLLSLARECYINGSSALIRKHVFDSVGLFDEQDRYTYDYDMWFRVIENFELLHVPEPLVRYRVHPGQGSKKYRAMILAGHRVRARALRRMGTVMGSLAVMLFVKDELMLMPWRIKNVFRTGDGSVSLLVRRVADLFKALVDRGAVKD